MSSLPIRSEAAEGSIAGVDWGAETGLSENTEFDRTLLVVPVGDPRLKSGGMRDQGLLSGS